MQTLTKKKKILLHDKVAAYFFLSTILFLSLTAFRYQDPVIKIDQGAQAEDIFLVVIKGAVKNPGTYQVHKGALIESLIHHAVPKEEANLSRLSLQSGIKPGQTIHVPQNKKKRLSVKKQRN